MKRGILIFATKHPYYGRMAYNLACTIKSIDDTEVAVVSDDIGLKHLGQHQINIFDHVIYQPSNYPVGFACKLYADKLTPFDQTLLLDADMLWLPYRTPTELFDQLSGVEYTGITEGWIDLNDLENRSDVKENYHFWADPQEIKEVYNLNGGILYQWRSEVIYFEKTEKVKSFFATARKIYASPKLKTIIKFVDKIPDELCINISAVINAMEPHKKRWTPAYWDRLNGGVARNPGDLKHWFLVSFGNHWSTGEVKKMYDTIARMALKQLGRQHVFSLHSKKEYLPERTKM